jgi:hypothetical protein
MEYSLRTKIIILIPCMLIWFVFGLLLLYRGSIDKANLKVISGDLEYYEIINIDDGARKIDILTFKIKGLIDRPALYLNNREKYKPFIDQFQTKKVIKIMYNDKGHSIPEGYNLHIFQIDYGMETLINYNETTDRDKNVGKVLFIVGIIFGLPIIYIYRKEKREKRKYAGNNA